MGVKIICPHELDVGLCSIKVKNALFASQWLASPGLEDGSK